MKLYNFMNSYAKSDYYVPSDIDPDNIDAALESSERRVLLLFSPEELNSQARYVQVYAISCFDYISEIRRSAFKRNVVVKAQVAAAEQSTNEVSAPVVVVTGASSGIGTVQVCTPFPMSLESHVVVVPLQELVKQLLYLWGNKTLKHMVVRLLIFGAMSQKRLMLLIRGEPLCRVVNNADTLLVRMKLSC